MNILELPDRERALRDDVRLVGRVLGDTVRQQQGEAVFATVERIRQISIAFRREGDAAARRELEAMLDSLSHDRTIEVVRAFSYLLASRQHRRGPASDPLHARAAGRRRPALRGTIQNTLASLKAAGVPRATLQALFDTILVSPVLTAHPTEVRRKSVLDREMEVAQLLADRDRMPLTPREAAATDSALSRAILTLWQTSLLRRGRPTVVDEVSNGLSYYDHTFFREVPRALRRPRGRPRRQRSGLEQHRAALLHPHGKLDRRRSRRQSVRERRRAAPGHRDAEQAGARFLSRRVASARRRAVAQPRPRQRVVAARGTGQPQPGQLAAPRVRAVSAGHRRHLRAARRLRARVWAARAAAPRGGGGEALRQRRRTARRSRHPLSVAGRQRLGDDRARTAAHAAARGRGVRLPSRQHRPAAELGRARARPDANCSRPVRARTIARCRSSRASRCCWPSSRRRGR